jgi:hypothetical protein
VSDSCFVDGSIVSLEEHHLRLQAEGGTTGQTIHLCASCHSMCHKAAKALQSKHPKTRAKAYQYIPVNLQQRAMIIIKAILEGGLTYEVEKDQYQDHAILNMQIALSPRQRARLHMLKDRHGFTNLEAFMAAMIAKMTGVKAWPKEAPANTQPPGDFDL